MTEVSGQFHETVFCRKENIPLYSYDTGLWSRAVEKSTQVLAEIWTPTKGSNDDSLIGWSIRRVFDAVGNSYVCKK
jgi:hypothetical protein